MRQGEGARGARQGEDEGDKGKGDKHDATTVDRHYRVDDDDEGVDLRVVVSRHRLVGVTDHLR